MDMKSVRFFTGFIGFILILQMLMVGVASIGVEDTYDYSDIDVETFDDPFISDDVDAILVGELLEFGEFEYIEVNFEYREVGETTWEQSDPTKLYDDGCGYGRRYSGVLYGGYDLEFDTYYEYRASIVDDSSVHGDIYVFYVNESRLGAGEDPIEDWYDLDDIRDNPTADYELGNDLDENTPGYDEIASSSANKRGVFEDDITGDSLYEGEMLPLRAAESTGLDNQLSGSDDITFYDGEEVISVDFEIESIFYGLLNITEDVDPVTHVEYKLEWEESLGWLPIASGGDRSSSGSEYEFTGIFDGNGHAIRDLYISRFHDDGGYTALFAELDGGARVKNVDILDFNIERRSGGEVGVVAGYVGDAVLEDISVEGEIYGVGCSDSPSLIGGLVGYVWGVDGEEGGSLMNVSSVVSVDYRRYDQLDNPKTFGFGGIARRVRYGMVSNTSSDSILRGWGFGDHDVRDSIEVAGLIGANRYSEIRNSYSVFDVEFDGELWAVRVGGLTYSNGGEVYDSYAYVSNIDVEYDGSYRVGILSAVDGSSAVYEDSFGVSYDEYELFSDDYPVGDMFGRVELVDSDIMSFPGLFMWDDGFDGYSNMSSTWDIEVNRVVRGDSTFPYLSDTGGWIIDQETDLDVVDYDFEPGLISLADHDSFNFSFVVENVGDWNITDDELGFYIEDELVWADDSFDAEIDEELSYDFEISLDEYEIDRDYVGINSFSIEWEGIELGDDTFYVAESLDYGFIKIVEHSEWKLVFAFDDPYLYEYSEIDMNSTDSLLFGERADTLLGFEDSGKLDGYSGEVGVEVIYIGEERWMSSLDHNETQTFDDIGRFFKSVLFSPVIDGERELVYEEMDIVDVMSVQSDPDERFTFIIDIGDSDDVDEIGVYSNPSIFTWFGLFWDATFMIPVGFVFVGGFVDGDGGDKYVR